MSTKVEYVYMWLLLSFAASFAFATVHVIDSYCVDDVYEKPWMGMIVSAMTSVIALLPAPYILPLLDTSGLTWPIIGAGFLAGILIQVNQALYFEALEDSDAPMVSAYWNMIPALTPICSYIVFRETLTFQQYIGIASLVTLSVILCLLDGKIRTELNSFILISIASVLQIFAIFLMDFTFSQLPFYLAFCFFTVGVIATGIFPLLFKDVKIAFKSNIKKYHSFLYLFVLLEVLNLVAYGLLQSALTFGSVPLVSTLESLVPANVFIVSYIGAIFFKNIKKNVFVNAKYKIGILTLMIIAVKIIS